MPVRQKLVVPIVSESETWSTNGNFHLRMNDLNSYQVLENENCISLAFWSVFATLGINIGSNGPTKGE